MSAVADPVVGSVSRGQTFRSTSAWVYTIVVWAFCALCAVLAILQEPAPTVVRVVLSCATAALLAWAILLRPHLRVGETGVVVSNVWRTHVIPFAAIAYVRTRGLVEVVVQQEDRERVYRSWNAPGNTSRAPRMSDPQARNHLRGMGISAQGHTHALKAGSGAAGRLIEERMDAAAPGAPAGVRSTWNVAVVAAVLTAIVVTAGSWAL
nr:PH domain-containing protein [Allobranchiibius sp. GilTou38]